jgi:hypothetical protein
MQQSPLFDEIEAVTARPMALDTESERLIVQFSTHRLREGASLRTVLREGSQLRSIACTSAPRAGCAYLTGDRSDASYCRPALPSHFRTGTRFRRGAVPESAG